MAYQAIKNNIVPPLIENEHRYEYLTTINNKDDLCQLLDESIVNSLKLMTFLG